MNKILVLIIGSLFTILYALDTLTTSSGKKVLLKDDFTWVYLKTDSSATGKLSPKDSTAAISSAPLKSDSSAQNTIQDKNPAQSTPPPPPTLEKLVSGEGKTDFRKARWGMSKEEIKKTETALFKSETDSSLIYRVDLFNYVCDVHYIFGDGKLTRGVLYVEQTHVDPDRFYKDYLDLKKLLKPIFGTPIDDQQEWINEMYRHEKERWGFAISIGFLICKTSWENRTTSIVLTIEGARHTITTNIVYSPRIRQ